jgi:glutamyl-tRNA reductase
MEFIVLGVSYKNTPLELREGLAVGYPKIIEKNKELLSLETVKEVMMLCTCNRVEIYAVVSIIEEGFKKIATIFKREVPKLNVNKHIYKFSSFNAIKHVFRVASSLDAMVVGEPQILGQVKNAFRWAQEAQTIGFFLGRLLDRAFSCGKKVRRSTDIGKKPISVSHIAVELAKEIFGSLKDSKTLLIGTGKMGEQAARYLKKQGTNLMVMSRTYERSQTLAQKLQAQAKTLQDLKDLLKQIQIMIVSTSSSHFILTKERIKPMLQQRQEPLFIIDIGVPRNIDPKVGELSNVVLYNIDDLQKIVNKNLSSRIQEAQKAEKLIIEEVSKFMEWYHSLELTPTITGLKNQLYKIAEEELEKTLKKLSHLSQADHYAIKVMTEAILNKILSRPIEKLKHQTKGKEGHLLISATKTLFELP